MGILLTGSSGFIGRHCSGFDSIKRVVVRNKNNAEFLNCDHYYVDEINGNTDWSGAFDGIDAIIHLAALAHDKTLSSEDYKRVNVDGALHLARQAAIGGVKRFVFVSSIGVHGSASFDDRLTHLSPLIPENAYTHSKLETEIGLKKLCNETGLELVIVRPTLVYGPIAPGNFGLLTKLISKTPFLPFGLAKNKRDFISVQNLADLLLVCATHPDAVNHTFIASDMETVSIKEFTNAISIGLGKNITQFPVPISFLRLAGRVLGKSAMVEQLVGNLAVDSSNINEVLGWTPPYTIEESMVFLSDKKKGNST